MIYQYLLLDYNNYIILQSYMKYKFYRVYCNVTMPMELDLNFKKEKLYVYYWSYSLDWFEFFGC